jgi:hypothetical protein
MNVEIGAEAAQFPEKEYINGIAVAVWGDIMFVAGSQMTVIKVKSYVTKYYLITLENQKTVWADMVIVLIYFIWGTGTLPQNKS